LTRTILDDIAALPEPQRQAAIDQITAMVEAAFLLGFTVAWYRLKYCRK
jgi:hypothetical protein